MNMLPSDRYLCSLLGVTEEEFVHFQVAARQHLKDNPIEGPIAGTGALAIASLVLSIGATAISALLRPSLPDAPRRPSEIQRTENIDDPVITNQSFAPRYGFDSVQSVVKLGSTVPLVIGERTIGGTKVGGVRLNMPIIWSQMLSLGTSQMLRAVFLAGEGEIGGFDNDLWAVGSNLLKNYKYTTNAATETASRATIYVSRDTGPILESDRVFGRSGVNDRRVNGGGSSATSAAGEVFKVQTGGSLGPVETAAFCSVHTPSTNTAFGVYSLIGNDLGFKVNPVIRPGVKVNQRAGSNTDEFEVRCPKDGPQIALRRKFAYNYASFSGITKKNGSSVTGTQSLSAGDNVTYALFAQSERQITFTENGFVEESKDVASSVAARQTYYDQNLIIGELYKIGTALGVCVSRGPSNAVFRSEADEVGTAQTIEVVFKIVEPGYVAAHSESHLRGAYTGSTVNNPSTVQRAVATTGGHILRFAQATVTNTRACDITEIGINSILGQRLNGLCNFRDAKPYDEVDDRFCQTYQNTVDYDSEFYQSGTLSVSLKRFAFLGSNTQSRQAAGNSDWVDSGRVFAVQSETMQSVFNFLRIEFTTAKLRVFRLKPISGFEFRQLTSGTFILLDANEHFMYVGLNAYGGAAVSVAYKGKMFNYPFHDDVRSKFAEGDSDLTSSYSKQEIPGDPAVGFDSLTAVDTAIGSGYSAMVDEYITCAEDFVYEEISSSAANGPEHRVAYVNEIVTGQTGSYANLALVGINIRSSTEWQQFTQFSGYVESGIKGRRLDTYSGLPFNPAEQSLYRFPETLLAFLTNERYGGGEFVKDDMIDLESFKESNDWCSNRGYYFNGGIVGLPPTRQYAADLAATHLLYFAEINGQFTLRPALPVSGSAFVAADIKGLFTVGNILEDSYEIEYLNPEDREPIEVSVSYREERASSDAGSEGAFSVVREALVSESGYTPLSTVSLDMTDYCTRRNHAIDAAKFLIRMRRIADHVARFQTTHESIYNNIAPGDYIKIAMDATEYEQFNNGIVTNEGGLVSTNPLSDGTYSVYAWNPSSGNDPAAATLTVSNGGTTASPTGILFTEILNNQASRTYQVERIAAENDGTFTIEALHMPVNTAGVPLVADGFDTAGNWNIA